MQNLDPLALQTFMQLQCQVHIELGKLAPQQPNGDVCLSNHVRNRSLFERVDDWLETSTVKVRRQISNDLLGAARCQIIDAVREANWLHRVYPPVTDDVLLKWGGNSANAHPRGAKGELNLLRCGLSWNKVARVFFSPHVLSLK